MQVGPEGDWMSALVVLRRLPSASEEGAQHRRDRHKNLHITSTCTMTGSSCPHVMNLAYLLADGKSAAGAKQCQSSVALHIREELLLKL